MATNTIVYTPGVLSQQLLAVPNRYDILQDDFARQIVSAIESKITTTQTVLSFDVFDTLLLRNHQSELRRFYEVSALVAESLSNAHKRVGVCDVLMARLLANRLTYRLSIAREGCREGTITDIYRVVLNQCGIPATDLHIQNCIDIELSYEVTQLTVNQPIVDSIKRYVQQGGRVIYISDMYLGAVHINSLLSQLGIDISLFAARYSSADTILSKRSGKIWQYILDDLSISSADLLHVGDSLVSDYQSPRLKRIDAIHLPIPLQMRRDIMADHGVMVHQLESLHMPIQSWMSPPHW